MSKFDKPAHKRIARVLGFALTLGTEADWWTFSGILYNRRSRQERAALAYFSLMALDEGDAHDTASAALWRYVQ